MTSRENDLYIYKINGYVVKLLCCFVHMDFNTNMFRRPSWLAHSSVILHTNCRQKFKIYTKTTWSCYMCYMLQEPWGNCWKLQNLCARYLGDSHEHERALKCKRTNNYYCIEYLKINFLRCLHAETSSLRLFNVARSGFVMMYTAGICRLGLCTVSPFRGSSSRLCTVHFCSSVPRRIYWVRCCSCLFRC